MFYSQSSSELFFEKLDLPYGVQPLVGMKCTATYCNTLQHSAIHCNAPEHTATQCNALHRTATYYNTLRKNGTTLQLTAIQFDTLQHTVIHCNTPQHTATQFNALQHAATQCDTLQYTAPHYSTLQHTAPALLCTTYSLAFIKVDEILESPDHVIAGLFTCAPLPPPPPRSCTPKGEWCRPEMCVGSFRRE